MGFVLAAAQFLLQNINSRFSQPTCTLGHLSERNLYFVALDPPPAQPYTEIVGSWREVPAGPLALAERCIHKRRYLDAEDFAGWLQLLDICPCRCPMAPGFP